MREVTRKRKRYAHTRTTSPERTQTHALTRNPGQGTPPSSELKDRILLHDVQVHSSTIPLTCMHVKHRHTLACTLPHPRHAQTLQCVRNEDCLLRPTQEADHFIGTVLQVLCPEFGRGTHQQKLPHLLSLSPNLSAGRCECARVFECLCTYLSVC